MRCAGVSSVAMAERITRAKFTQSNHEKRNDEGTPERGDHAHDATQVRYGVKVSITDGRHRHDDTPHSVPYELPFLPTLVSIRADALNEKEKNTIQSCVEQSQR